MPIDALTLRGVVTELAPALVGKRIDRVQQSAKDQVLLTVRGTEKLLFYLGTDAPRLQLTAIPRENPAEPPMFCMLLRKHLVGARIREITQPALERLVRIDCDATDELGRESTRTLILEAMGRRSNLILLDEENRIIDCLRRVDADMSRTRQLLPGLFYELPESPERKAFTDETEESFYEALRETPEETTVERFLLGRYFGLSPLLARELACRAAGDTDARVFQLTPSEEVQLWQEFSYLTATVQENRLTPILLRKDGVPFDLSAVPITQYGTLVENETFESFSELFDLFFAEREKKERMRQRSADLRRTAATVRDRLRRKAEAMRRDLQRSEQREQDRLSGELITANLYRLKKGDAACVCENYYEEGSPEVSIPMDPLLTPQQNAAKYYKRYRKACTAEGILKEQVAVAERDLAYLESVLAELDLAETEQDLGEIRAELQENGFVRAAPGGKKQRFTRSLRPREFTSSGGFRILVGRNNRQNEQLTFKTASYRDLWFHTQKIHGSHVILCTEGREPSEADREEAAMLAAWFSQARESAQVPVDYTEVRALKKAPGGRTGMVFYHRYETMYVTPAEEKLPKEHR